MDSRLGSLREFVRDMWRYVGPRRAARLALLLGAGTILEGVGLLLLLPLLGLILGTGTGIAWIDWLMRLSLPTAGTSMLAKLLPLLGVFGVLMALRSYVILKRDVAVAQLQSGFVADHRLRIMTLLASAPWHVVARLRHGRITHVQGPEIQAIGDASQLTLQIVVATTLLFAQIVLVLILSPVLALLILLLLGCSALALRPVFRRARELGLALTGTSLSLMASTTDFLGGLKLALSQNLQGSFVERYGSLLAETEAKRIETARQRTLMQVVLTAFPAAIAAAVILVGIGILEKPPSLIVGFLLVLSRMAGPTARIQASVHHIFHSLPAYALVRELQRELGARNEASPEKRESSGTPPRGDIELVDVSYAHREGSIGGTQGGGIFELSATIREGSFVGITGPSGAGKTTLADILVGLYPPQSGRVLVGGSELDADSLSAWRDRISYVSQDPFLFHDTVRANILWARPGASEDEIWRALEMAGADDLVRKMEHQLETVVGERGSLVSGGERQRIALARALLRRPILLVLDEATNAIDVPAEAEILHRLANAPERPTILMIAHREASLRLCQGTIQLEHGRLVRAS